MSRSSESQGLQVALILSAMLIVALGVSTYIYYVAAEKSAKELENQIGVADTAAKSRDSYQAAYEIMKGMVGWSKRSQAEIDADYRPNLARNTEVAEEMAKIEAAYNDDMQKFGSQFTEARNYHALPGYLIGVINSKNESLTAALAQEQRLNAEIAAVQAGEQKKTEIAETAMQNALATVAADKAAHDAEAARLKADSDKFSGMFVAASGEKKKVAEDAAKEKANFEAQIRNLSNINELLVVKGREEELAVINEQPDGKISWVNQQQQVVWIDLGMADGLRRGQTFSVVDREATDLRSAIPKAQIEVTRLIDKHLSEAKILSDEITNPILPADVVFSPAWSAGERIHFALVGNLDYDGDGESDHKLVQNVILSNNGVIDALVPPTGEPSGEITVNTRYIVVGDRPTDKSDESALTNYSSMTELARKYGVEQISVKKLLSSMGYRGEARTVGLGRGASEDDFRPTSAGGVTEKSTAPVGGIFRDRRPPGAKSAF
ncbi:hypothetical protein [Lignipirellula cremea]|uniref:Uncharacterized protein n=1 Tax=Lignipirellula cremea TaxID=2528010 RepID=A0A518DS47_9BACT|nr:hypothetical protein [Lignipirellula cremea]QDU94670.1 hypothetical protein Pla8534_24760 [Lignipirellula cremea]